MTEADRKMDEMIKAVNAYKNKFPDHDLPPMMGIGFKDEYINKLKDLVENNTPYTSHENFLLPLN